MDVSIIIVSFSAASYLKGCLDSIFKFTKITSFEVIVVDNASADDSVEVAKQFAGQKSQVTVIQNSDNRGFGAGVNIGLKKASGKYILILNPDIKFLAPPVGLRPEGDTISRMVEYMEKHPDVGMASCQFLDGEQKMLPNGGYFPTLTRLFAWCFFIHLGQAYHPRGDMYKKEFFPDWVTGSFMFVRREVVDKVEGLDENIFMYGEEVEWQYRIRLAGWKIGYTPEAKVIHFERQSSGGSPKNAVLGEFRGLKYIYGKHFPGWKQIVLGSLLDLAAFNRIILWLIRRNKEMVKIYLEALTT